MRVTIRSWLKKLRTILGWHTKSLTPLPHQSHQKANNMMNNPHDPAKILWDCYIRHMNIHVENNFLPEAKETAHEYYDRWEKQCEKQLKLELAAKRLEEAVKEPKEKKIKPKRDRLKS
jgi:hypothetical protein